MCFAQVGADKCKMYHQMCLAHGVLADLRKAQGRVDDAREALATFRGCMSAITRMEECHSYIASLVEEEQILAAKADAAMLDQQTGADSEQEETAS